MDDQTDDPLYRINFLCTPRGRRKALQLLKEQIEQGVPVNWAAQDELKRATGHHIARKPFKRRRKS